MRLTSALLLETKSYITNSGAIFGTLLHPVVMLAFLILLFDPNDDTSASFRFATLIGLTMLNALSIAIFGLAGAIGEARAHHALSFYITSPLTYLELSIAFVLSRLIIIMLFSICFISLGVVVLDIGEMVSPVSIIIGLLSLAFSSIFFFGLALLIARFSDNAGTMSSIGMFVNIYFMMSSGVYIPLEALPKWSEFFVTLSPVYHLSNLMLAAFSGTSILYVITATSILCILGALFTWLAANRRLFIAMERSR